MKQQHCYELYILLTGVEGRLIFRNTPIKEILSIYSTDQHSDWLLKDPERKSAVDIAEAMLINRFKPEYTDKMKTTKDLAKLKTYRALIDSSIDTVSISLDLFFEEDGHLMRFAAPGASTSTKGVLIGFDYSSEGSDSIVTIQEVPDRIY